MTVVALLSFLAKCIISLIIFYFIIFYVLISLPSQPLDTSIFSNKDITALPSYTQYKTISTKEDIVIHYIEAKDPKLSNGGPVILFLHGYPESALLTWHAQIAYFANKGYHVIASDQRGFNHSTGPASPLKYMISRDILNDTITLLQSKLKKGEKAFVVGHDWGGHVAWNIAAHRPDLISKLIILNCPHPAVFIEHLKTPTSWYMIVPMTPFLPEKLARENTDVIFKSTFDDIIQKGLIGIPMLNRYRQLFNTSQGMFNWYRAIIPELFFGSSKRLDPVTVPTLILWGRKDPFCRDYHAKESFDKYTPKDQSELEYLDEVGHWVTHHVPDLVNEKLLAFIVK